MSRPVTRTQFVCQWYPPEPAQVPEGIVEALGAEGLHVDVLTGVPNYPTGVVADGYSAWRLATERRGAVTVRRTPLYPSHDSSAVKRMASYVSWAISASVFGQGALRRADVALVYSSPATAALPAMIAKQLWGTPYVLLVQDVWPDSIFASGFLQGGLGKAVHWMVDRFVRRTYANADHVAVISSGMVELLASRGVPRDKLSVVYNWVPEEGKGAVDGGASDASSLASLLALPEDTRLFLYAGNHGHAQALDGLVRAFLDERTDPAHLVLLGDGVTKETLVTLADGHPRVHFLDPVDRSTAGRLIVAADVSVVSLADEPLFAVTMPSKVQTGLASARPLLVVARGDAASVVVDAGAGATALPGDVDSIVEAVRSLALATRDDLAAMGRRGRAAYFSSMARSVGAPRLADLLSRAASRRARRGGMNAATNPAKERS